jgi:ADP-heptose:LPS heptosyltransferase
MSGQRKHKIRLMLKLLRLKNIGFLTFTDKIISRIKPPRTFKGSIKKVLFIRSDRIGDAIVTLPELRDFKMNYPEIQLHVISSNKNRFIFDGSPFIDKLLTFGQKSHIRRVFEYDEGYTGKFALSDFERILLKIFLFGRFIHFMIYFLVPYVFSSQLRNDIRALKEENYDVVFDLKGVKRIALVTRLFSNFTAGSRLFLFSWLYSYYMKSNWVSHDDNITMSVKIENLIKESTGLKFTKRNKDIPYLDHAPLHLSSKKYDVFFHIGTSELRKLNTGHETLILNSLKDKKVIVTDSYKTERLNLYKEKFNFEFRLYNKLEDCITDVSGSKLILCYDGGQAHYLSQFGTTIVIFGPGSVNLWKPYEFEDYEPYAAGNTQILKSRGKYGHMVVYNPIWCSPCFDIGCKERPCLNKLDINLLIKLIREHI